MWAGPAFSTGYALTAASSSRRHASTSGSSGILDSVEAPLARNAFQLGRAALGERDPGSGDEVAHGLRDEHLAGRRARGDARADGDGDPGDLPVVHLAF